MLMMIHWIAGSRKHPPRLSCCYTLDESGVFYQHNKSHSASPARSCRTWISDSRLGLYFMNHHDVQYITTHKQCPVLVPLILIQSNNWIYVVLKKEKLLILNPLLCVGSTLSNRPGEPVTNFIAIGSKQASASPAAFQAQVLILHFCFIHFLKSVMKFW